MTLGNPLKTRLADNERVDTRQCERGSAASMVLLALAMIGAGIAAYVLPTNTFADYGSEELEARVESECGGPPSPAVLSCTRRLTDEERRADRLRRSPSLLVVTGGIVLLVNTVRTAFRERGEA